MWTGNALHLGHTVVLMDKWTRRGDAAADRPLRRHLQPHGARPSSCACSTCPEDARAQYDVRSLRNMIHGAAPCPQEVKRQMIEWWGDTIQEYYAATEGGGTVISRQGVDGAARLGRPALARQRDPHLRRRGQPARPPAQIGTVYMQLMADFEYKGDSAKTKANRIENFFTVGDLGELDEDGYLFLRDRKSRHDHLGRGQHLPGRDRGRAHQPPRGRKTSPCSASPTPTGARRSRPSIELHEGFEPSDELAGRDHRAGPAPAWASSSCPRRSTSSTSSPASPTASSIKRKLRDPYWEGIDRQIE